MGIICDTFDKQTNSPALIPDPCRYYELPDKWAVFYELRAFYAKNRSEIASNIRNPLIFQRKMATSSCLAGPMNRNLQVHSQILFICPLAHTMKRDQVKARHAQFIQACNPRSRTETDPHPHQWRRSYKRHHLPTVYPLPDLPSEDNSSARLPD